MTHGIDASTLTPKYLLTLHLPEPDFTRPLLRVPVEHRLNLLERLTILYGTEVARECYEELERLMQVYYAHKPAELIEADRRFDPAERFTEKDVILITYGDLIRRGDERPLRVLVEVLEENRRFGINTIHILPFFPYSSDRGFSIVDYEEVDPRLGSWEEIEELSREYRLMFDGVFNHVSSKSRWFQEFLNGNPRYRDWFITFSTRRGLPKAYLDLVLRPRTSSLLTGFETLRGRRYVWTTFSPDQIDLNYKNPEVLLKIIEILLYYIRRGADIIRLDAVTYLWTELGTSCALLEESHVLVQLFRAVLDVVAPQVALVAESNVPHKENISYLGDGTNEAQMVYNFALPPLVLQAFQTGSCARLIQWAQALEHISDSATYFNFLDSHDGIGLLPVSDILTQEEIEDMVHKAADYGAMISYRTNSEGTETPYELNTTWYSALNDENSSEPIDIQVDRFMASRAIALVLKGVPGIYLPSLVGTRNDIASVLASGEARGINRGTLNEAVLREKIADRSSIAHRVFCRFGDLIRTRIQVPAFHPNAEQIIPNLGDKVFCVIRRCKRSDQTVVALTNVTEERQRIVWRPEHTFLQSEHWNDLLDDREYRSVSNRLELNLEPYAIAWLTPSRR